VNAATANLEAHLLASDDAYLCFDVIHDGRYHFMPEEHDSATSWRDCAPVYKRAPTRRQEGTAACGSVTGEDTGGLWQHWLTVVDAQVMPK
jgi:hypothetical protein